MCDGYIFKVSFRDMWAKKETTDLRLNRRKSFEHNNYYPASRLGKKKKRNEDKKQLLIMGAHTYTHPPFSSLHLTPIRGTSSTSATTGG